MLLRFPLRGSILLGGLLLLLTSCSLTQYFDKTPINPDQWPDFSGEWQFKVTEGVLDKTWAPVLSICQNGPELVGYAGDTNLYGLVDLDGVFEVLASFFVPGTSLKWIIWGNSKDNRFDGYYKPEETQSFFIVRYEGQRLGPVRSRGQGGLGCPEGFRREAAYQSSSFMNPLKAVSINQANLIQFLDPSQWPSIAGEWHFSVTEPKALQGRRISIPICQLGPELHGAFVEDAFIAGLIHLDGKFALIVHQYVGRKMSVWTLWGDLTKTKLEGYYKPWNSTFFYAVKLEGYRIRPVPQDVNCPRGFRGE